MIDKLEVDGADYSSLIDIKSNVFDNVSKISNCNFNIACLLSRPNYNVGYNADLSIKNIQINNSSFKNFEFSMIPYNYHRKCMIIYNVNFKDCDMQSAHFNYMELVNCRFENISFNAVSIENTIFNRCTFVNVHFEINHTKNEKITFKNCNFKNVTGYSNLFDTLFQECDFDSTSINTFKNFRHEKVTLSQSILNLQFHDKNKVFEDIIPIPVAFSTNQCSDITRKKENTNVDKIEEDFVNRLQSLYKNNYIWILIIIGCICFYAIHGLTNTTVQKNYQKSEPNQRKFNTPEVLPLRPTKAQESAKEIQQPLPVPEVKNEYNIEGDNNIINIHTH